jgi:hypothetical protein
MDLTKIFEDAPALRKAVLRERDELRLFFRGKRWTRAEQESMRQKSKPPLQINMLPPL